MKIRTDYVTNSSSSSFVIGFKGDKSKWEVLRENLSDIFSDHLVDLIVENSSEIVDKEHLEELVRYEYLDWSTGKPNIIRCEKAADDLRNQAETNGFSKFFTVEVDDYKCTGHVEHDIMLWLDCTLQQYSHH